MIAGIFSRRPGFASRFASIFCLPAVTLGIMWRGFFGIVWPISGAVFSPRGRPKAGLPPLVVVSMRSVTL